MCLEYQLIEKEKRKSNGRVPLQSFGEWMIENLGENAIETYWAKCNIMSPFDIGFGSSVNICINCIETNYHDTYITTPKRFKNGNRCNYCSHSKFHSLDSFAHNGIITYGEDFLGKYWSVDNKLNPYEIPYYSKEEIYLICQKTEYHNSYPTTPLQFFKNGGCSYCSNLRVHPRDSLSQWGIDNYGEDFLELFWSKNNTLNPWELKIGSEKPILINYQECEGYFETTPSLFTKLKANSDKIIRPKIIEDSFAKWYIKTFNETLLREIWSVENNDSPWDVSTRSKQPIIFSDGTITSPIEFVKEYRINNPKYPRNFKEWFEMNLPYESFENYWSTNNIISSEEVKYNSKNDILLINCLECGKEYEITPFNFTQGRRCTICRPLTWRTNTISFAEWGIKYIGKSFIEDYWGDSNDRTPYEYPSYTDKVVWIKCQNNSIHNEYPIMISNFTKNNARCSYCAGKKVHPSESLGQYLADRGLSELWSEKNKNDVMTVSIQSSTTKLWWKCPDGIHDDFQRYAITSNSCDYRCPRCVAERTESFLQSKVRLYISDELKYNITHEFNSNLKCYNPKTNYRLPYDNDVCIGDKKLIIEVHGIQHYEITGFTIRDAKEYDTTPEKVLAYQQWKDQYKKEYALSKGYYYLEIPYWTDNNNEEWKQLIDDKIKDILHNN